MNIDVDITEELEQVIAEHIFPAQLVGKVLSWNLRAGVLTAGNVKLANSVYGQKQVSLDRPYADNPNKVYRAVTLALLLIEHIRKEGKRQVAPEKPKSILASLKPAASTTAITQSEHVNPEPQCPWPNGPCICEGSKYR